MSSEQPHEDECAIYTCRWCDTHETTHDALQPECEFSPCLCNCAADAAAARERTPSGYTVAEWMDEMVAQQTTIVAVMRELLAELKRCEAAGETIDMQSDLIVRAYDTVGVLLVTQREMEKLFGPPAPETP